MLFDAMLAVAAAAALSNPALAAASRTELSAVAPEGHTMAGELLLPPGQHSVPVIMLISGTGRQSRDFEAFDGRYHPHRDLAEALLANGIGVIRFDERNTGRSTGDHRTASSLDLQNDARLLFELAAAETRVDKRHMYIFGHSEGAVFAMRLAASEPNVAGVVLIGAPFKSGREMTRDQVRIETRRSPGSTDAEWEAALAEAYDMEIAFQQSRPSLADLLDYDGAATARSVGKPALILEGAEDWQVSPPQGRQLAEAMLESGNRSVTYRLLPQVGHLMTHNPPGIADYEQLSDFSVAPQVLSALVAWIGEHSAD